MIFPAGIPQSGKRDPPRPEAVPWSGGTPRRSGRVHHRGTQATEKTGKSGVFKGLYVGVLCVSTVRFLLESASIGEICG